MATSYRSIHDNTSVNNIEMIRFKVESVNRKRTRNIVLIKKEKIKLTLLNQEKTELIAYTIYMV